MWPRSAPGPGKAAASIKIGRRTHPRTLSAHTPPSPMQCGRSASTGVHCQTGGAGRGGGEREGSATTRTRVKWGGQGVARKPNSNNQVETTKELRNACGATPCHHDFLPPISSLAVRLAMQSPAPADPDCTEPISSPLLRKWSLQSPGAAPAATITNYAEPVQLTASRFCLPPRSQRALHLAGVETTSPHTVPVPEGEREPLSDSQETLTLSMSASQFSLASPDPCPSLDSVSIASARSAHLPPLHPLARTRCHTEDALLLDTTFFGHYDCEDRSPSVLSSAHSPAQFRCCHVTVRVCGAVALAGPPPRGVSPHHWFGSSGRPVVTRCFPRVCARPGRPLAGVSPCVCTLLRIPGCGARPAPESLRAPPFVGICVFWPPHTTAHGRGRLLRRCPAACAHRITLVL